MNPLSKNLRSLYNKTRVNAEMVRLTSEYFDRCYSRNPKKQRLVWVNLPSIVEIFYAFEIIPFMPEAIGGFISSFGYSMDALDKAYSMGFSRDACTFCNHVLGAIQLNQLPKPDMVVSTMLTSCDAQGKSFESAAHNLNVPFHLLHLPSKKPEGSESAVEFLTDELVLLVTRLEKYTGQKMDTDKLLSIIQRSNEVIGAFIKFLETRKRPIPPIGGVDAFINLFPVYNYCNDIAKTRRFYEDLHDRLTRKRSTAKNEQPIRLVNVGHYFPLHDTGIMYEMENQGATFVAELFSTMYWTKVRIPEKISKNTLLEALARRYLDLPTVGTYERRASICGRLAREWNADGAVCFLPWGCRVLGGSAQAITDKMKQQLGIPTCVLDCDPIDSSIYARESVKTRLQAFLEMVKQQKTIKEN